MAVMTGAIHLTATTTTDLSSASLSTAGFSPDSRPGRSALSRDASAFRVMASMRTPRSDAAENGLSHATAGKNTSVRKGDPHITLHHPALAEARKKGTAPASGSPICER